MPKISIIVPCYNAEKYLPKCLDSLINQTLKDIEIICVNDGSTDGSLSVLKDYAKKDSRIVIIDKENSGPGACRNIGIEKATGEFIQFVDSDDWIEPETCEVCYQKSLENDVDMVSFNANIVHSKKTTPLYYYNTKKEKLVSLEDMISLLFKSPFHSWHFLFKKDFLTQHQIKYPEHIVLCEDVIFSLTCWIKAKKALLLPNLFYNYVQLNSSITHSTKHVFDIFNVIKELKKIISPLKKTYPQLEDELRDWVVWHLNWFRNKLTTYEEKKKFKKMAYENKCVSEYYEMMKKIKNPTQSSFYFKLFGILPILTIKKKNQKIRYRFLGLPVLTIKQKGNVTKYTCLKICLIKIIKK